MKSIMKKNIWVPMAIWIILLLPQNVFARCGAGTVLYFKSEGEIYLLLADHKLHSQRHRGWSGFGGRCDADPVDVTAARETEEETKGFYSREDILARLRSSPKVMVGDFTTFFVAVDYVPAIVFINQRPSSLSASYVERGPYAWIPFSEIWRAIEKRQTDRVNIPEKYLPANRMTGWLFEPFVKSLTEARKANNLPWAP
jgi:hypothetical protein